MNRRAAAIGRCRRPLARAVILKRVCPGLVQMGDGQLRLWSSAGSVATETDPDLR